MLMRQRTPAVHMGEVPMEIERRFLIEDAARLPALGKGRRLMQCYLPRWKIELDEDRLAFEGEVLVPAVTPHAEALAELFEGRFTPRVRLDDDRAFVTIKGRGVSGARPEFEWEVAPHRVEHLVTSFRFPHVIKRRHVLPAGDDLAWEVDIFEGENAGLVLAEIELPSLDADFERPNWLGPEVTEEGRYTNAALARDPICDWD